MRTCAARRWILWLLVLTLPVQGPGCAWIMNKTDDVMVTCNVPGATIKLNGNPVGAGKQFLETGEDFVFTAEAPGYHPATIKVYGKEDFAGGYLALDLLWVLAYGAGLVFLIVDFASGSIWHPTPRNVEFELQRDPNAELASLRGNDAGRDRLLGPNAQRPPAGTDGRDRLMGPQPQRPAAGTEAPPARHTEAPPPRHTEAPPARPTPAPVKPPVEPKRAPPRSTATEPPPRQPEWPDTTEPPGADLPLAEPIAPPGRTVILAIGPDAATSAGAAELCELGEGRDARRLLGRAATRREVLRAVRDHLERNVGKDDRAVLYFSGRVLRGEDGELYLASVDTDPARLEETAIPAATLSTYLERVEGALLLVVVDAESGAESDEVATLLAEGGALAAVAPGQAATTIRRGLAPGGADQDRDALVSGDELLRWLGRELSDVGAVRGVPGKNGALPVKR